MFSCPTNESILKRLQKRLKCYIGSFYSLYTENDPSYHLGLAGQIMLCHSDICGVSFCVEHGLTCF